jgi:hypothetical protein
MSWEDIFVKATPNWKVGRKKKGKRLQGLPKHK